MPFYDIQMMITDEQSQRLCDLFAYERARGGMVSDEVYRANVAMVLSDDNCFRYVAMLCCLFFRKDPFLLACCLQKDPHAVIMDDLALLQSRAVTGGSSSTLSLFCPCLRLASCT